MTRAEEVLRALEEGRESHKPLARIDDLPLFGASAPVIKGSAVEDVLKTIEPDALSPKQALELLYSLKKKLPSPGGRVEGGFSRQREDGFGEGCEAGPLSEIRFANFDPPSRGG